MMLSTNSEILIFYLTFYLSYLIALDIYNLIAMERISSTIVNGSGENWPPCLVPDAKDKHFYFSLIIMFVLGVCFMLTILKKIPSILICKLFITDVCLILSKSFYVSVDMIIYYFMIHVDYLHMLNHP